MKVGIESAAYLSRYGIKEGLARLKRHGYDTIDLQDFVNTETELFRLDAKGFEKKLLDLRKDCEDAEVEIFQAHGPWRWPPMDATPEERAERFEKMARSIEGTAIVGCRNFVIHPIMPFGDYQDPEPETFYKMNFEFMNRLCDVADRFNVTVCLENMPMPRISLATPKQILDFVKDVNRDSFKVCLDTGHCAVCGVDPAEAVRMTGKDYLAVLHVHDNDGRGDLHWLPGFGVINWKEFGKALLDIGYNGSFSLETRVPGNVPESARESMEIGLFNIANAICGNVQSD